MSLKRIFLTLLLVLGFTILLTPKNKTYATDTFRITEYYISPYLYTGTTYTLTLNQDLSTNYFVIIQGSDGDLDTIDRNPDENYIRLRSDPFSTGDLITSAQNNQIGFIREATGVSWSGVVKVIECLNDCDDSGFVLKDVLVKSPPGIQETTYTTTSSWTDFNKIVPFAGAQGSGCTERLYTYHNGCNPQIWPSGTNSINIKPSEGDPTVTIMVTEWGSEWTIQRATVTGYAGGSGIDDISEYNTATINSVKRENTWVWGTGYTNKDGIGDSAEAQAVTLGDGVTQLTDETKVAVGSEGSGNRYFDVYTLTHPTLSVDYDFVAYGDRKDSTKDITTDTVNNNIKMSISYNSSDGTTKIDYPIPIISSRYYDSSTIRLERRRTGQNYCAWVQGIDFSGVYEGAASQTPLVLGVDIVDSSNIPITSPSIPMNNITSDITYQTATGTLGTSDKKIRVTSDTTQNWNVTIIPEGVIPVWSNGSNYYDIDDSTAGAIDGEDTDQSGGQMSMIFNNATITPDTGCTLNGISFGSNTSFTHTPPPMETTNSITLLIANSSDPNCTWYIEDIALEQTIPALQPSGTYTINMIMTITAI